MHTCNTEKQKEDNAIGNYRDNTNGIVRKNTEKKINATGANPHNRK